MSPTRICLCCALLILCTRQLAAQTQNTDQPIPEDPSQRENVNQYEPLRQGERNTDTYTGQFWYKVRTPRSSFQIEHYNETIWRVCWVYDPATCSNVARRYPTTVLRQRRVRRTRYETETLCAQVTIPRSQVVNGGVCDCDLRVPYEGRSSAPQAPSVEAPESTPSAAEDSANRDESTETRLVAVSPRPPAAARPMPTITSRRAKTQAAGSATTDGVYYSTRPTTVSPSAAPATYYPTAPVVYTAPIAVSSSPVYYGH